MSNQQFKRNNIPINLRNLSVNPDLNIGIPQTNSFGGWIHSHRVISTGFVVGVNTVEVIVNDDQCKANNNLGRVRLYCRIAVNGAVNQAFIRARLLVGDDNNELNGNFYLQNLDAAYGSFWSVFNKGALGDFLPYRWLVLDVDYNYTSTVPGGGQTLVQASFIAMNDDGLQVESEQQGGIYYQNTNNDIRGILFIIDNQTTADITALECDVYKQVGGYAVNVQP